MFKERIITTLKKIGVFFVYLIGAAGFLVGLYFLVSWDGPVTDKVMNIVVNVLFGIIGLMAVLVILLTIYKYLNWQFIEPYKEWRNRGRDNIE